MEQEIQLYQCHRCGRQVFEERIERGDGCGKCGSRHVAKAHPTARNIAVYLLHHPRAVLRFVIENVLPLLALWKRVC